MDGVSEKVVEGLATHKLIPFFGAGASAGQLGVDWKAISDAMANEIDLSVDQRSSYIEVAERFYSTVGADRFAAFLKSYLIKDSFDDIAAWPHIFLLSLNAGLLYTTNQDNLFELCAEKFGRPHRVISRVEDLAETAPNDNVLIKYHGDLSRPETVIFTESSYRARIGNKRHFLNIRLQSDLLSKGFVFIGYSLRDQNIRLLFQELREAFGGALPPSYFVAYHYDADLEELNRDFGVQIINPQSYVRDVMPDGEAFERYLKTISENVHARQHRSEISELFTPSVPRAARIATIYEIDAVQKAASEMQFSEALTIYRSTFDRTFVPPDAASSVLSAFEKVCAKATTDADLQALQGAVFNMTLPVEVTMEAIMHVMIAINRCSKETGFPRFMVLCPRHPSVVLSSVALAIAYFRDKAIKVREPFLRHADMAASSFGKLTPDLQKSVRALLEWAWQDTGSRFPRHIIDERGPFAAPPFEDIMQSITDQMPKA